MVKKTSKKKNQNSGTLRKTGIDIIGNIPWGTHFCQFYQTREDLIDILVPYFKAGLGNNEFCMWVTSEPLKVEDAKRSLRKAEKNLDGYIEKGQMEILDYSQWYTKTGKFDADRVLKGWSEKEKQAIEKGFDGLRFTGNTFWLEKRDWKSFADYEAVVNNVIMEYRMLAICSYSLDKCQVYEVIDVVNNHQFALIKKQDKWVSLESSERKRSEEELKQLKHQHELILQSAGEGILGLDLEGKHIFVNPASSRMLGYEVEELIGKQSHTIWHHSKPDGTPCPEEECLIYASYRKGNICLRIRDEVFWRKDGTSFPVAYTSTPILEGDKIIGAVVTFIDITDRKQAEEALRESEEKYRSLFEDSKDVVYISTIEGKFLDINSTGVELFGYDSKEELLKVDIAKDLYLNPYDRKKFIQTMQQQGFVKDYELLMERKDGEILTLLSTATPYRDKEGKIIEYRGIMRDVTQQRKLEQQLFHAQKMEAVGQLSGGIAHDFNNILTAIIGYSTVLQMKMSKDDPLRHKVDQILASSERAANLTQSLLAFSRKQIIDLQPVKINEIVKRVEKLLLRIIGEDIEMKTILNPPPPPFDKGGQGGIEDLVVMADSGQIEQVLMNLATNARDAMPDGGLLSIETERIEIDEEYIKTHGYGEPGMYALISFTDTGAGMDEMTRERIFEPFFTTKEVGKGTGLGLSMIYGIIKQHNGYINVYSEVGKGTTFKIYLPLTEAEIKEIKPSEPAPSISGKETILLAEDDADVRKFTKYVLEEFGYTVVEAVDGEDAIHKFMEYKDRIEFLLLDVIMPKKNGKEVYEEIKKVSPDVKALFMSGYTANVVHKRGILEEGLDFVLKPISPTVLLRKIRKVLER